MPTTAGAEVALATMGAKIRKLREKRDLSRDVLAVRAGIASITLANIERGDQDPKGSTLRAIADELGVTVDELLR